MVFSFPFRTGVLRRVLSAYRNVVPSVMIAMPALMGTTLLLITIPSILAFLNTETRLIGGNPYGALDVQSDCDDLSFEAFVQPYPASTDPATRQQRSSSLVLAFSRRTLRAPPGMDDEGGEPSGGQSFRDRFGPPNCESAVVTLKAPGESAPTLRSQAFDNLQVEELDQGVWRVEFKGTEHRQTLSFDWPALYAYSQEGFGWINARLDDFAAGASFLLSWSAESEDQELLADASLILFAPPGFNADYARELAIPGYGETLRAQNYVQYSMKAKSTDYGNLTQPMRVVTGAALFRTEEFGAKQNFTLLVGGAMLGLGITLLVESLIAVIFKLERRFARRKVGEG